MRVVIDMQGAQSNWGRSGRIGRYTMSLVKGIAGYRGRHQFFLAMNALFPDTIEPIRAAFDGVIPQENIRLWYAPTPVASLSGSDWNSKVAEYIRENFLAHLNPDIVLLTSLFEGLQNDAVTSVKSLFGNVPTAVILYDLIPLNQQTDYLETAEKERWYFSKLDYLRRADLLLAISESSRQEAIHTLGFDGSAAINIASATDAIFTPRDVAASREHEVRERYDLKHPFVICVGDIDHPKSIEGLIRVFAGLSENIRAQHQLVVACPVQDDEYQRFVDLAGENGLKKSELLFTGFIPDEDIVDLYNLCTVVVVPAWHEGVGLTVLEAMACGAAVIGANISSLSEVMGREDSLFDQYDNEVITAKLTQVLTDKDLRKKLVAHGLEQAKTFSWDASVTQTIFALEQWCFQNEERSRVLPARRERLKLAYVSPLPPERSGISDYSAMLLPELGRYYEIDVVVAQQEVNDSYINAVFRVRTVDWFRRHAHRYDRVLYHFGNSQFHQHMFNLLEEVPGVVVLHDFFLANIVAHMDATGLKSGGLAAELFHSHGYQALAQRFNADDITDAFWRYPCNLSVLQNAQGVIVHSQYSSCLVEQWYAKPDILQWVEVPLLRAPVLDIDRVRARRSLGLDDDQFLVCAFGLLGLTKLNHRLIQAWVDSALAQEDNGILVFVGENHKNAYGASVIKAISKSGFGERIRITGWAETETFQLYMAAADVGVQLRTKSRGETSAAVFDCMNYGVATIVNANGSMADLEDDCVWKLPDDFTDAELIEALETLWRDSSLRSKLGARGLDVVHARHNPHFCSELYFEAIERFSNSPAKDMRYLINAIADLEKVPSDSDLSAASKSITRTIPPRFKAKQLLLDISALVHEDLGTGIQRVVRSVLRELVTNPPRGFRVEPVYAIAGRDYRYARSFTLKFLGCPVDVLEDELLEYWPEDIFLGLDLHPQVVITNRDFYRQLRRHGVKVKFVVYDLLCVLMPHYFVEGITKEFPVWLDVVAESDGAICISRAVADELYDWVKVNGLERQRPFKIGWFHLGADIISSASTKGLMVDSYKVLESIRSHNSFLMVGTIEARKGYAQVLAAFEDLWSEGIDINLVIVGKAGWLVEELVEKLRNHSELNRRLHWLEGISDKYLDKVYAACNCLIAASEGEGFGLPLIEAAQHKLPIIARDIPVFREVAGEHACYFSGDTSQGLSCALRGWLQDRESGKIHGSDAMPWLTWSESTEQIFSLVLDENDLHWIHSWK